MTGGLEGEEKTGTVKSSNILSLAVTTEIVTETFKN